MNYTHLQTMLYEVFHNSWPNEASFEVITPDKRIYDFKAELKHRKSELCVLSNG